MTIEPTELRSEDEQRTRFVREIAAHAALPAHATAEAAAVAVMDALSHRLTPGGAHVLWEALPFAIRELLAEGHIDERKGPITLLDRAALLDRTAAALGVTPVRAERICESVFRAVRAAMPSSAVHAVAAQLPNDLRALWYAAPPEIDAPTLSESEPEDVRTSVFAEIERTGELPRGIDGAAAFMTVMCAFSRRLSGGEARHLFLALPETLRPLLTSCMVRRDEPASAFGREELVRRVSERLESDPQAAEDLVRTVFAALRRWLPEKDIDDTASQLPADLRALWLGS